MKMIAWTARGDQQGLHQGCWMGVGGYPKMDVLQNTEGSLIEDGYNYTQTFRESIYFYSDVKLSVVGRQKGFPE